MKRKIVHINENLCNGCGQCIPSCVEQALQIIDGKAKIVKDLYCDGLGACLGHCPQNAITLIEREAEEFNQKEVHEYINRQTNNTQISIVLSENLQKENIQKPKWPIKIDLISPKASFFENANILFAADCAPVILKNFHEISKEKQVIIGCPKFNDARTYATKLSEILKHNNILSITIVHMEVPCCIGLKWVVNKALENCPKKIPTQEIEVKIGAEKIKHRP